jgi:hypothetical protein
MTIYFLFAIGFKGVSIRGTGLETVILNLLATLVVGSLMPVGVYFSVKRWVVRNSLISPLGRLPG